MHQLNIDCEGPITQNDNAFELCEAFIPDGGSFFAIVSKYDDFLADVEKRKDYKAGDTLRLILPFLKAHGVTDQQMEEFSENTLVLLPGTDVMLPKVASSMPTFIISTSYKPYLEALCRATGFPLENVYCTEVSLDAYEMDEEEAERLRELAQEIAAMKMPEWPHDAEDLEDLEDADAEIIRRLDEIFWSEIAQMSIGSMIREVNPIGGVEKANSVEDSLSRTGLSLSQVIYAGDSITDVQALDLVRQGGGTAISFNGNRYAIKSATWACLAPNTAAIGALSEFVEKRGEEALREEAVRQGGMIGHQALLDLWADAEINSRYMEIMSGAAGADGLGCRLHLVEMSNQEELIAESEAYRKGVRGIRVGNLG